MAFVSKWAERVLIWGENERAICVNCQTGYRVRQWRTYLICMNAAIFRIITDKHNVLKRSVCECMLWMVYGTKESGRENEPDFGENFMLLKQTNGKQAFPKFPGNLSICTCKFHSRSFAEEFNVSREQAWENEWRRRRRRRSSRRRNYEINARKKFVMVI